MIRIDIRDAALASILDQADYYATSVNTGLAQRWELAVDKTILTIKGFPRIGSLCSFRSRHLSKMRRLSIYGFPRHLLFYRFLEEENAIVIHDVLHGTRDLENLLATTQVED